MILTILIYICYWKNEGFPNTLTPKPYSSLFFGFCSKTKLLIAASKFIDTSGM